MSLDLASQEERIQSLADILSLIALVGGMEKAAIQRVLLSLGTTLLDVRTPLVMDRDVASRLLVQISKESGSQAALEVASDVTFVAKAWRPVLDRYLSAVPDTHRPPPYAEIVYALVNHTGSILADYDAFAQFGGPDLVLPMLQLSAALAPYPAPKLGLSWTMVGFETPDDQALIAADEQTYYLFKAAATASSLRVSELDRGGDEVPRREHDIRVDPALFAAFAAGLLGDMLFWAARLRQHAAPGHEIGQRLFTLLNPIGLDINAPRPAAKPTPPA